MKIDITAGERSRSDAADFATAINAAGHGRFQYAVFTSAAVIYFSSGLQSAMNGFILPSVKCEFMLSSEQMGMLNSAFLIGGVLTGQMWGALSDSVGRRPVLLVSALLDALFTLAAALAPSFPLFFACRLLSGMMNTAPAGLSFLYLGEFITDKKRSPFMIILGAVWTIAWTLLPALAWLVVPQPWALWLGTLRLGSWRLFLSLLVVPDLCSAALAFYFPETPKFLQTSGQEQAALSVLHRIFTANTGGSAEDYPVKHLQVPSSPVSTLKQDGNVFRNVLLSVKNCIEVLRPPVLGRTMICTTLYFCNMSVLYGFGYWLPELLNQYQQHDKEHPNSNATVCQVFSQNSLQGNHTDVEIISNADCSSESTINPSVFLSTLIVNGGSLIVNLVGSVASKFLGRRTMCCVFSFTSGIAGLGLLFASSVVELVAVCTLFIGLTDTGCIAINALIVDIFPPRYSGAGVSSVMLSGRLGGALANITIGYLLDASCQVPLLLCCALAVGSGILACFAHRPYVEKSRTQQTSSPAA